MFKVGDVVMLKSGGPWMTVNGLDTTSVYTRWFVDGHVHSDKFSPLALVKEKVESASAPLVQT